MLWIYILSGDHKVAILVSPKAGCYSYKVQELNMNSTFNALIFSIVMVIFFWGLGAVLQRFYDNPTIERVTVVRWLAKLLGSKTTSVDVRWMGFQIYGIAIGVLFFLVYILESSVTQRFEILRIGLIVLALLTIILIRLLKKSNQ